MQQKGQECSFIVPEIDENELEQKNPAHIVGIAEQTGTRLRVPKQSKGPKHHGGDYRQLRNSSHCDLATTVCAALAIPSAHFSGEYCLNPFQAAGRHPCSQILIFGQIFHCTRQPNYVPRRNHVSIAPSSRRSSTQPAALLTITGNPHAMASLTTKPHVSV